MNRAWLVALLLFATPIAINGCSSKYDVQAGDCNKAIAQYYAGSPVDTIVVAYQVEKGKTVHRSFPYKRRDASYTWQGEGGVVTILDSGKFPVWSVSANRLILIDRRPQR